MTAEARAHARLAAALDLGARDTGPSAVRAQRNSLLSALLRGLRRTSPPVPTLPADPASEGLRFETDCGFEVRGSTLLQAWSDQARVEVMPQPARARVHLREAAAVVLLRLGDGSGVLLPALRGFATRLVVDDGELADLAFEPVPDTPRWAAFAPAAAGLRALRGVVSQAARDNAFRPEPGMVDRLAERMAYAGHLDPSLALYAAHACHELQQVDRIGPIAARLRTDLGIDLFDLALLSRAPWPADGPGAALRLPPVPLLARGWSLLSALGATLPAPLAGIERHLQPSLWTHFDSAGCDRLRDLILTGRLP